MVKRGLISRIPSATDQRSVEVSIRPKGLSLVETLTPEAERIQRLMMEAFWDVELPLLKDFLRRLYTAMSDLTGGATDEQLRTRISANDVAPVEDD